MAISPPSDIILDVTRAADPMRQQVAFERLSRMSVPGGGTQFASVVDDTTGALAAQVEKGLASARERLAELHPPKPSGLVRTASLEKPNPAAKTMQQFEAQVISTFIESMMPESTTNTYGEGMAGGVWRCMLSEQIAGEIAKNGGLGIKEKVLAAIQARYPNTPSADPAQAADPVASLARALDRTAAITGANGRDMRIPLSLEQKFLDTAGPAPSAAGRTSIFRQA